LLAVAILAVGMLFVGGTFVLAIHFSTLSTERTIAAVVAEEAVAKIRLYGIDPTQGVVADGQTLYTRDAKGGAIDVNEFGYPSVRAMDKQYAWSALCRWIGADTNSQRVQVTVFVCRVAGIGTRPIPLLLDIDKADDATRLYEGSLLVDDEVGRLYRVASLEGGVKLDRPWEGGSAKTIWVIPRPQQAGGRNPCITVYQTELVMSHAGAHAMGSGNTALYAMEFTPQTGRVR
jgi:hypothetical protein